MIIFNATLRLILLLIITSLTNTAVAASPSASTLAPVTPACHAPAADSQPTLPGSHVAECTPLNNLGAYPPSSGSHFGTAWANYQTYDQPITDGYWLHSLEHGAVVILYNCPKGCPEDVLTLKTLINSLPSDPRCTSVSNGKTTHQMILAPNSHLDSTFAVVAWGWLLKTNCLDPAAIHNFYSLHSAHAPENLCNAGVDKSATHWCNEPQLTSIRTPPSQHSARFPGSENLSPVSLSARDPQGHWRMTFETVSLYQGRFFNICGVELSATLEK